MTVWQRRIRNFALFAVSGLAWCIIIAAVCFGWSVWSGASFGGVR